VGPLHCTCGATDSLGGGSQTCVKPADAMSGIFSFIIFHQPPFSHASQPKPCVGQGTEHGIGARGK